MIDTIEMKKIRDVLESEPDRIVLSNRTDGNSLYKKVVYRKMVLKGRMVYQKECFTEKQVFHENIEVEALPESVLEQFSFVYLQMNVFLSDCQWDYKVTKKGKLLSKRHGSNQLSVKSTASGKEISYSGDKEVAILTHNRKKNYLLREGMVIPPLVDLGIFTKDGKVVRSMYDKYKQINRFLEFVEDVVKEYSKEELHIIDFGCGKSYLTFILYYYLVEVKQYKVRMTGLDLKEEVIRHCNETAQKYGYENLHFELGDINGYQTDKPVDMVVTLHACDTATDYALYNAIQWGASIILSVPCCQKEVNGQIQSQDYSLFTRYGIVKERVSALMTDAIRANVLQYCGYKTQILEFVDFASSPKNMLIRAVKGNVSKEKRETAKKEILQVCTEFHIEQTLVRMVFDD